MYEAELIEHKPEPFYQRKVFVSAMIAVTLLAIGVAVLAVVLPSNNSVGNTGGAKTSSDGSLLPDPDQAPQTSPPSNDPVEDQKATVPRTNEPSSDPTKAPTNDPTKTPTSSPTSNVSRRKKSRISFWFLLLYFSPQASRPIRLRYSH